MNYIPFKMNTQIQENNKEGVLNIIKYVSNMIPTSWQNQRIVGRDYPGEPIMTNEEIMLFLARRDYIMRTYYIDAKYVEYVFDNAKNLIGLEEKIEQEIQDFIQKYNEEKNSQEENDEEKKELGSYETEEEQNIYMSMTGSYYGSNYDGGYDSY